jgi:aromatic-L-amino-acid decarboxylase
MKEKHIRALQAESRVLEPDSWQRSLLLQQVLDYAESFIESISSRPVFQTADDDGRGLYDSPISENGIDMETALRLISDHVDTPGLNPTSDRFLGYIPGGALYHSALGDYLAAVTNRYAGYYFASPGAVRMENMLWNWMADIVGYPPGRGGTLTSGGSIASLAGVVTARDAHQLWGAEIADAVVYMTDQVHHAVGKALRIAGLGRCVWRTVPVDDCYRMDPDALDQMIVADKQAGLKPWLVIASAGTTNTSAVDPLQTISQIAHAHQLWFHVDGAYGAFFMLCPEGRAVLKGIDQADSLVMDPHKTLFLPYGTGAVLVRDGDKLYASHHEGADYMQDGLAAIEEPSPADLSPELTRHFRGLRLWLPLKLLGVAPFRAALSEKILLARYFHEKIQGVAGFEVGPRPELSVATYRYRPARGDANEFNRHLAEEVQKDGRVFVSSTVLDGRFTLRLAVGVYRTHLDAIEQTIEVLQEKARRLEKEH